MKCTICNTEIRGRYWVDPWQQTICASHKVEHCSSCGRFVKPSDLHLPDGRCLCASCHSSVVRLPQHIEWVEKRVRSILASCGVADIPQVPCPSGHSRRNGETEPRRNNQSLSTGIDIDCPDYGAVLFPKQSYRIYIRLPSQNTVCRCAGS